MGNIAGARQVFERWMEWQPEEQAWHSYINFELRYKEVDRARTIYERYILWTRTEWCHDCPGCCCSCKGVSWSGHTVIDIRLEVKNASLSASLCFVGKEIGQNENL